MKFTVRKQHLQEELSLCQGVVEAKSTIPILAHLLVTADKNGLEIVATDLEIGLRTRCVADVTGSGAAAIPARKLFDVIRALDCETVSFETEGNHWLRIEGGSFRGRLVGLPDSDFPSQPEMPAKAATVALALSSLQDMVSRVLFAVTTENTRFSINGALMTLKGGRLMLVATDGHRLAQVVKDLGPGAGSSELHVLVPRKVLQEITRLRPADENEEIEIATSGNHVFFRGKDTLIFSRVLEGTFPNFERVIPSDNENSCTVERAALSSVLSRVAILTSDSSRQAVFSLAGGALQVATSNPNMGEAQEELAVEHSGEDVRIGLNVEYVQQFLSAVSGEKVEIRLKNGSTQALFVPQGDGPWECRYVVMPMRLA